MKHVVLKLFSVLSFLMLVYTSSNAQVITVMENINPLSDNSVSCKNRFVNKGYKLIKSCDKYKVYAPVSEQKKSYSESTENKAIVTCDIIHDDFNSFFSDEVAVINSKGEKSYIYSDENGEYSIELPFDKYDFIYFLQANTGLFLVVKENINIESDTTIVFDTSETSVNYIQTYRPDGELGKLDVFKLKDEGGMELVEKGNLSGLNRNFYFTLDGKVVLGFLYSATFTYDNESINQININKTSERFKILTSCKFAFDGNYCFTKYEESYKNIIKNKYEDFKLIKEKFIPSPNVNIPNNDIYKTFEISELIDNSVDDTWINVIQTFVPVKDGIVDFYINLPKDKNTEHPYDVIVSPGILDKIQMYENEIEDENGEISVDTQYVYSGILGPEILGNKKGQEYVISNGHNRAGFLTFLNKDGHTILYPGNQFFKFSEEQKVQPFGYGCPINSVMIQGWYDEYSQGNSISVAPCYIGRYNEVRKSDRVNLGTLIKYNGEIICNDYEQMENILYEPREKGVFDITFENKNVIVKDIKGKNKTDVHFDTNKEDFTAPTLQMLWFKNNDNLITEHFTNSNEGMLEFAGGDFNYVIDENYNDYFDCAEQDVEVSFAPYNTEEWLDLPVNEIPENFFMPGFGYFYRGSLDVVKSESDNGWFDLKIKLTDKSGNYQEQIISPAFYIEDSVTTGINSVNNTTEIDKIYTANGKEVKSEVKGINIIRYTDGSVKKVFVN